MQEIQKKRRGQMVLERNTSSSDDVILDEDSLPDALDGGSPFQNKGEEVIFRSMFQSSNDYVILNSPA